MRLKGATISKVSMGPKHYHCESWRLVATVVLTCNMQTSTKLKNAVDLLGCASLQIACLSTFSKAIRIVAHSLVPRLSPHVNKRSKGKRWKAGWGLGTRRSYTHQFAQIRVWEAVDRLSTHMTSLPTLVHIS